MKTLFSALLACFSATYIVAQDVNLHVTHDGQPVAYHTVTIKHGDVELGNGQTDSDGRVTIQANGLMSRAIDVYGYYKTANTEKKWSLKGCVKLDQSNHADIRMDEYIKDIASKSKFMTPDMLADSWGMPSSPNKEKRAVNPSNNNNNNNNNPNITDNNGRGGGTQNNNNNNTNNGGSQDPVKDPSLDNLNPKDDMAKAKAEMDKMRADMERERNEMRANFNNNSNDKFGNANSNNLEFSSVGGEQFTVLLNGVVQNSSPSNHVSVAKPASSGFAEVEIRFQNSSIPSIKQSVATASSFNQYEIKKMGSRYILKSKF